MKLASSKFAQDSLQHFLGGACTLEIRSQHSTLSDNLVNCSVESVGAFHVAKVAKHQSSRSDGSQRIGDAFALNVGRRSVHTLYYKKRRVSFGADKIDDSTYGSPITKLSPALMEGINPNEPTRAAAASLSNSTSGFVLHYLQDETHEIMSPYRLGATITSKILRSI